MPSCPWSCHYAVPKRNNFLVKGKAIWTAHRTQKCPHPPKSARHAVAERNYQTCVLGVGIRTKLQKWTVPAVPHRTPDFEKDCSRVPQQAKPPNPYHMNPSRRGQPRGGNEYRSPCCSHGVAARPPERMAAGVRGTSRRRPHSPRDHPQSNPNSESRGAASAT